VSKEKAYEVYGVVLEGDSLQINFIATLERRKIKTSAVA
jgi:hypothetical protein